MRSTQAAWEARLEEARQEWEKQYAAVTQASLPAVGIVAESRCLNLCSLSLMFSLSCHLYDLLLAHISDSSSPTQHSQGF